ncbi:Gfo/Idh/MocA family protein [Novipirellula artificiosorum]|uniref:Inositol 2-dehydrogenase n=1 Tax=Novipirellula artificiosorum TaxID=2528016 RepID=A0A5C6DZJ6_9BACT|nr:Gfo/Idh/MocA family oxidoreductase [Novipirellula artificiosorum]TWU42068.1 Inositol 2-dehydrogenase [Novipirellula artificiosorum]
MRRRDFCKAAGLTAAAIQTKAFAAATDTPLRVGLIGTGWYGKTDLFHLMQVAPVDVVGLCDVDRQLVNEAAELVSGRQPSGKKPAVFGDYRELLSQQKPEIVLVGTPDHWHCLPMIEACKSGADVYVQKPISFDVVEGQAMVAAARKYDRTVQVGLQRRSTPHLLEARDRFIESGLLGKIAYVDIHSYFGGRRDFPPVQAPPSNLDWEQYVGPASWRDYNPGIHPRSWRDCIEFSNGQTGDLCVHFFDTVRYFLGLGWPKSISASGGRLIRQPVPGGGLHDTQTALFDFGETQIVWNQRNWGANPDPEYPWGATLYGDKGTLKLSVRNYDFIPKNGGESVHGDWVDESDQYPEDLQHKETEVFAAPATRRHMKNFLAARQQKTRPVADIEQGHISSACCIMANLSMRIGRSLTWDAEQGKVVDDVEANQRLARVYRAPYVHPTADSV